MSLNGDEDYDGASIAVGEDNGMVSCLGNAYHDIKHCDKLALSVSNKRKHGNSKKHVDCFLQEAPQFKFNTFDEMKPKDIEDILLGSLTRNFETKACKSCKDKTS